MKTVPDTIKNAEAVLDALLDFKCVAQNLALSVAPFEVEGNGRTLPRFIVETSVAMKESLVHDFGNRFPALSTYITNGEGISNSRLHDACFNFNIAQREILKHNCVIKDDATRQNIFDRLNLTVADIIIYTCMQFDLMSLADGQITVAVQSHCERTKISPDVFYGILMQDLCDTGNTWFAYEKISPRYSDFMEFDAVFASECEEAFFPITDADADKLIYGEVPLDKYRIKLNKFLRRTVETDKDEVSPSSLVSMMKLD